MKKKILLISGILLFCFTFWSSYIKSGHFVSQDFAFTVKLQERIDSSSHLRLADFVGNIMEGSTFFASPEFSVGVVIILTGILCIDFKKKRFHFRGLIIPILFTFLVAAEIFGKTVVHHPAPPFFMIKNPTTVFPKYYINEQFSYPSGHTARAIFLAIVTFFSFVVRHKRHISERMVIGIGVVLSIYVALVSISRVYLGHHWLSDIIGGTFLGASCGLGVVGIIMLLTQRSESHIIPKQ